jgi:undecaprenyl-diphosphatase
MTAPPPATVHLMHWNTALFQSMHATANSPHWMIAAAIVIAQWTLWIILAIVIWHLARQRNGGATLRIVGAWFVSNRIEALVSAVAFHPRPFAAGYGPAWIEHAANNSMPSSHVVLALILLFALARQKHYRSAALATVLTAALAWARIYIGIHWPVDMLGALASAAVSIGLVLAVERLASLLRKTIHRRLHPAHAT